MQRTAAVACALAALASAQSRPSGRDFLPLDYHAEAFVDLDALRALGLTDDLERNLAYGAFRSTLHREYGIDTEDLRRIRVAARFGDPGAMDMTEDNEHSVTRITVFDGEPGLRLADPLKLEASPTAVTSPATLWRERGFGGTAWYSPRPGLVIVGSTPSVEAAATGSRTGGVPQPELMPFTIERGALAYLAAVRGRLPQAEWNQLSGLPTDWFLEQDPIEAIGLRLQHDDGRLALVLRVEFSRGNGGSAHFATQLREALRHASALPTAALLAPLLEELNVEVTPRALRGTLDLGAGEEIATTVAKLIERTAAARLLGPRRFARYVEATPVPAPRRR